MVKDLRTDGGFITDRAIAHTVSAASVDINVDVLTTGQLNGSVTCSTLTGSVVSLGSLSVGTGTTHFLDTSLISVTGAFACPTAPSAFPSVAVSTSFVCNDLVTPAFTTESMSLGSFGYTATMEVDRLTFGQAAIKQSSGVMFPFPGRTIGVYDFLNPSMPHLDTSGLLRHASLVGLRTPASYDSSTLLSARADGAGKTMQGVLVFDQATADTVTKSNGAQYMDLSEHLPLLYGAGNFTVSFWFKTATAPATTPQYLFAAGLSTKQEQRLLVGCSGTQGVFFEIRDGASAATNYRRWGLRTGDGVGQNLVANQWYHVSICAGSSGARLYVNGVQYSTNWVTGGDGTPATEGIAAIGAPADFAMLGACMQGDGSAFTSYSGPFSGSLALVVAMSGTLTDSLAADLYGGTYGYDIYPLLGEKNMIGMAPIQTGVDDNLASLAGRAFQFAATGPETPPVRGAVAAVTAPLQWCNASWVTGTTPGASLWKTFAERILPYTHPLRKIMLVPLAVAGSGFGNSATNPYTGQSGGHHLLNVWNPSDFLYTGSTRPLLASARDCHPLNRVGGILVHLGETDESDIKFGSKFWNMADDLITVFSGEKITTPFIVGEVMTSFTGSHISNQFSKQFSKDPGNIASFVGTADLVPSGAASSDFSAAALQTLGVRYADALIGSLQSQTLQRAIPNWHHPRARLALPSTRMDAPLLYQAESGAPSLRTSMSVVSPNTGLSSAAFVVTGEFGRYGQVKAIFNDGGPTGTWTAGVGYVSGAGLTGTYTVTVLQPGAGKSLIWVGDRWV